MRALLRRLLGRPAPAREVFFPPAPTNWGEVNGVAITAGEPDGQWLYLSHSDRCGCRWSVTRARAPVADLEPCSIPHAVRLRTEVREHGWELP